MHRFYLLGGIALRDHAGDAADRVLSQSKVVATLAYLALSPPGRLQRRDRVVGLLWPELDQERARAALRKALHVLRTSLGRDAVIARGDEEVAVSPEAVWCDAAVFASACDEGALALALELYEGELMPGFHLPECGDFDLWLEEQRRDLRERAAAAAWALAERLESDRKTTLAGQWARRAVHYAGTDERVLRRTMTMLDRVGDRAGALRLYADFTRRLRKELEVDPSPETVSLASTLRSGG
jgi:DNA-binding SARP family transcriptional activator